ncbi:hypothetical protein ACLMJK_002735 [Lecanora helva]
MTAPDRAVRQDKFRTKSFSADPLDPFQSFVFLKKCLIDYSTLIFSGIAAFSPIVVFQIFYDRRWASEEATTQSEPEADGATEASQGDNSIAASADSESSANAPESSEQQDAPERSSSTLEEATETATETASSATEQVSQAAQSTKDSILGAAQNLGAAAGLGSDSGSSAPRRTEDGVAIRDGEPSSTVYVGNLFFDVRGEDLKQEFERAGRVVSSKVINDSRGLSKGIGFVEFETQEAAQNAISMFNQQNFEGRRLSVQYSLNPGPRADGQRTSYRSKDPIRNTNGNQRPLHAPTKTLFIGNMSFDMSDRDLNNLFREIKNVIDVRVAIDRRTGQPRGFAHADFVDVKDAEKAMEDLQGKLVCGRNLRVDFSTTTGRAAMNISAEAGASTTADQGQQDSKAQ